jgi:hypothetical protein
MATIHFGISEYIMKVKRESLRVNALLSAIVRPHIHAEYGVKEFADILGLPRSGENIRVGVPLPLFSRLGIYLLIKGIGIGEPNDLTFLSPHGPDCRAV